MRIKNIIRAFEDNTTPLRKLWLNASKTLLAIELHFGLTLLLLKMMYANIMNNFEIDDESLWHVFTGNP